jgi:lycopene beta-cyclase
MYDFIIAGMGGAGLSLAYRLNNSILRNKKILLIDKSPKTQNDRTWCFWTKNHILFDSIVYQSWDKVWFHGEGFSKLIPLAPYQYKMIRGIDFYDFILEDLKNNPNIDIMYGEVEEVSSNQTSGWVKLADKTLEGNWIFNSISPKNPTKLKGFHYLKQHFKGWMIETDKDFFDATEATFMDFRIEQKGETRFLYLLPIHARKCLVEFTVFSADLLPLQVYDEELEKYLQDFLRIENYQIIEEEFGVIPMEDEPKKLFSSPRVMNIGIMGGDCKPSSGYTFLNMQKQSNKIMESLLKTSSPIFKAPAKRRFKVYDAMLLDVLEKKHYEGRGIFKNLFSKHPIQRIFRFLDEETNFGEELKIMVQMPPLPFLKALKGIFKF